MANKSLSGDLAQLALAELHSRKNKLKGAIIGLGIVMVVALVMVLYAAINSKKYALLATLPAMFLSLLPSVIVLSKINKEIAARPPIQ
ncbi:hypothetical protein [Hymenobacter yonginensis]|uniref:Redox-active disulfide protein 2 n=1 Tax=Hymenobacter yonginensis TaxID=748197 RepID=A0ABY7PQ50_9BACT|nr:hypothetical protein [Hymenobacter yonginensis]WBO84929.1 hypothetical protein O9Z63_01490 [Hymenobacter yonginensis]